MTTPLHKVKRPCDLLVNIIWLFSESICFFFTLFFVFFETFVRIKFESVSEKGYFLRTKLEFDCHLIQLKPLFVFFKMPYKVLGIIRSKYFAFVLQVKCKQTFITLSLYFPLTLLWIGLRFFNKLLSIKNTFVYLVMCKIPRTEANFLLGTSQIRRIVRCNFIK